MASQPHFIGRASALPLSLIAQAIPKLSRHHLEALAERLIDRLDELDPDPDLEDGDGDYCEESDDRGTTGSNAHFLNRAALALDPTDADVELSAQYAEWPVPVDAPPLSHGRT